MKLLITGANGQLGTELQRQAICDVVAVDIDDVDIANLDGVRTLVSQIKPDAIINCAAFTNVDLCEKEVELAFRVNSLGPRNLAVVSENYGAKLVHVSTDYVFDGNTDTAYKEWDITNPQSVYGKSKILSERYVRNMCSKHFIVRTSWLYSVYGNNFVKTISRVAQEKKRVTVVDDQKGTPTNASELAVHLLKIINTEGYGIYHATGNGETCSWYQFASKIVEYLGIDADVIPCTSEEYPQLAKRPMHSVLDNMMLRNTVGDNFKDWDYSLKEFLTR